MPTYTLFYAWKRHLRKQLRTFSMLRKELLFILLLQYASQSTPIRCNWWMWQVGGASGWVLLNRGQAAMEGEFRTALARLPFALVELHPDNGREFFNDHLKRLFPQLVPGLTLSRRRRTTRMTTASSNRRMTHWYASMSATPGSTHRSRWQCSTPT